MRFPDEPINSVLLEELHGMSRFTPRKIWLTLAAIAVGMGVGSILLTDWLQLDPCHLCIFQRLLFLAFGVLALGAVLAIGRLGSRLLGTLAFATTILGTGVAAYQSWLQIRPNEAGPCIGSELGPIEQLVEWLGQEWPTLFLATGFCDDMGLVFLGLSLANWALIGFLVCLAGAAWALRRQERAAA